MLMMLMMNKRQTEQFLRIDNHDIPCVSQVSDLGLTVGSRQARDLNSLLMYLIYVKAHRKANLIIRCFESRNISSLTAAFKTCTSCTRILFGCLEPISYQRYRLTRKSTKKVHKTLAWP